MNSHVVQTPCQSVAFLRKGFLAESIPVNLRGIGGPGAPHVFDFSLRNTLGAMPG